MLKKLGLIALSSLLVLPAISSADTPELAYNLALYDSDGNGYQADETTLKGDYYLYVDSFVCSDSAGYECSVSFYQGGTKKCAIASLVGSPEIEVNTCNYLPAGTYDIYGQGYDPIFINGYLEELPTIGGGVEVPDDQINFEYFGSTLQGLVGNLVSSFSGILPILILIGFGVLLLFVFRGYIKHASVELFTMNRNGNKSLSWYQNEDINAMYNDRRSNFVKNHDVNNIVKNFTYKDVIDYYSKNYAEVNRTNKLSGEFYNSSVGETAGYYFFESNRDKGLNLTRIDQQRIDEYIGYSKGYHSKKQITKQDYQELGI